MKFFKYQGTGNDFIVIDDRKDEFSSRQQFSKEQLALLCNRNFGIGADGLILLRNSVKHDFTMVYYNSNGVEGTMCGNGGRCIVAFARHLSVINSETVFEAVDGLHRARVLAGDRRQLMISLQLNDTTMPEMADDDLIINTGSPHLIVFKNQLSDYPAEENGRAIRFDKRFSPDGINVNFVEPIDNETLFVRTYERGVEQETLSCGTGVTAAAVAAWIRNIRNIGNMYNIKTKGGNLKVSFIPPEQNKDYFSEIWLTGPATFVFEGNVNM